MEVSVEAGRESHHNGPAPGPSAGHAAWSRNQHCGMTVVAGGHLQPPGLEALAFFSRRTQRDRIVVRATSRRRPTSWPAWRPKASLWSVAGNRTAARSGGGRHWPRGSKLCFRRGKEYLCACAAVDCRARCTNPAWMTTRHSCPRSRLSRMVVIMPGSSDDPQPKQETNDASEACCSKRSLRTPSKEPGRLRARGRPRTTSEPHPIVEAGILAVEVPDERDVVLLGDAPANFRSSICWDIMRAGSPKRRLVLEDPDGL